MLNERQEKMLAMLKRDRRASVSRLASAFFVSEMTVRRDLKLLEEESLVKRYAGGAMYIEDEHLAPIGMRRRMHIKEKEQLCREAEKYLHDGMTVFLDISSTCMHLVPLLSAYREITVVTNSIPTLLFAAKRNLPCHIIGGAYYKKDMCALGAVSLSQVDQYNFDIGFFSALCLSDAGVISDDNNEQTALRKAVMRRCEKKVFLFDPTKRHKTSLYTLCTAADVDEIILL